MNLLLFIQLALTVVLPGVVTLSAQEPPAAPGSPGFIFSHSETLLVSWPDNSENEEFFTLHLRIAGSAQPPIILPANTNWYAVGPYSGSSVSGFVTATNVGGSSQSGDNGVYDPFEIFLDPFAEWRFVHWGRMNDSGDAAAFADPDRDGQSNILEFSLGSDPLDAGSLPDSTASIGAAGELQMSFAKNSSDSVELAVEFSSSLSGPWRRVAVPVDFASYVTVTDPEAPAGNRAFARIRVQPKP